MDPVLKVNKFGNNNCNINNQKQEYNHHNGSNFKGNRSIGQFR